MGEPERDGVRRAGDRLLEEGEHLVVAAGEGTVGEELRGVQREGVGLADLGADVEHPLVVVVGVVEPGLHGGLEPSEDLADPLQPGFGDVSGDLLDPPQAGRRRRGIAGLDGDVVGRALGPELEERIRRVDRRGHREVGELSALLERVGPPQPEHQRGDHLREQPRVVAALDEIDGLPGGGEAQLVVRGVDELLGAAREQAGEAGRIGGIGDVDGRFEDRELLVVRDARRARTRDRWPGRRAPARREHRPGVRSSPLRGGWRGCVGRRHGAGPRPAAP